MTPARKYIVTFCPACGQPHPGETQTFRFGEAGAEMFMCAHGGKMVSVHEKDVKAEPVADE